MGFPWLGRNRNQEQQQIITSDGVDELPPETPLPWDQIATLLIVRITEPINFTMIFPFMYFVEVAFASSLRLIQWIQEAINYTPRWIIGLDTNRCYR